MGDHQMQKYFDQGGGDDGMFCDGDMPDPGLDSVFAKVEENYKKSFADIGGVYDVPEDHNNCVIRVPHTVFFEVRTRDGYLYTNTILGSRDW